MISNELFTERMEEMRLGVEKYLYIMNNLKSTKVDTYKSEFQTKFNGFYRIRQRSEIWYKTYFKILENNKYNKDITLNEILLAMYNVSGNVEISFSSKLLHTINPYMPIYDKEVLNKTNIRKAKLNEDKSIYIRNALNVYKQIVDKYSNYSKTQNYIKAINMYNAYFPEYKNISDIKKIDFFLWKFSKEELKELGIFAELIGE